MDLSTVPLNFFPRKFARTSRGAVYNVRELGCGSTTERVREWGPSRPRFSRPVRLSSWTSSSFRPGVRAHIDSIPKDSSPPSICLASRRWRIPGARGGSGFRPHSRRLSFDRSKNQGMERVRRPWPTDHLGPLGQSGKPPHQPNRGLVAPQGPSSPKPAGSPQTLDRTLDTFPG